MKCIVDFYIKKNLASRLKINKKIYCKVGIKFIFDEVEGRLS